MARLTGRLRYYIDFAGDGTYSLADEITAWVADAKWSLGMHVPYQLVGDETLLEITLNNQDKRFSPELTTGPYFGNLVPERRIQVVCDYRGSTTVLYTGFVDKWSPTPINGIKCTLRCVGAKNYIQNQKIHMPLLQNVRADEILTAILERLHQPPAMDDAWLLGIEGSSNLGVSTTLSDVSLATEFDTGNTTFPYVADTWDGDFHGNQYVQKDWSTDFRGYDAIKDVIKAELGRFFFNREGKAVFWARDRLQLNTTLTGTFDEHYFIDAKYEYGNRIYNDVRVKAYPRTVSDADEIIYESSERFDVRRGKTKALRANYVSREGVSIAALAPYVDSISLIAGSISPNYIVDFEAMAAKFEFSAPDGNYAHDNLRLKSKTVTTFDDFEAQAFDGTSVSLYGAREMSIDSKLSSNIALAESIAQYRLNQLKDPRGEMVWVEFLVDSDDKITQALERSMGDRIRITNEKTAHDAEYFIIGEEMKPLLSSGWVVRWYLELADANQAWILGQTGYSELGVSTYLGV